MHKIYVYEYNDNYIKTDNLNILNHIKNYKTKQYDISLFAYSKLLEALNLDFNYEVNNDSIIFNKKPKLKDNSLYFSISHDNNIIAIIISDKECGIDITRKITNLKLSNKILSNEELIEFNKSFDKELYLSIKWAMKEAYYKYDNNYSFKTTINLEYKEYIFNDNKYYLSYKVGE